MIVAGLLLPFANVMGVFVVAITVSIAITAPAASSAARLLLGLGLFLLLHPLVLRSAILEPHFYLRFRQRQRLRQLLPLRADDVVIFLKGVFQFQQLTRTEGRPYSLRFSEGL